MSHQTFIRHCRVAVVGLMGLAGGLLSVGCQSDSESVSDAQPQWLQTPSLNDAAVSQALGSTLALRINLKTNRMSLYKGGQVSGQWNIASADVTGEFHDKQPQSTPTGIFAVEDMQACPEWLPRAPQDPKTGRVATNEKERWEIIKANPDLFGACGKSNPLGKYAIWFHGAYGVHGNSAEWILELANPEERRVSGGCIRNPNDKIKDLFHLVIDQFAPLASFKNDVLKLESSPQKSTLTKSLKGIDFKVVVGNWANDPAVGSAASEPVKDTSDVQPKVEEKQMKCSVISVDDNLGIAPTHEALPATAHNVISFYSQGDTALVKEEIAGTSYVRTLRGLLNKKYLGPCVEQ